jgi:hypothetical protein
MDSAAGPMELVAALLRGVTPAELAGSVAAGERAEVRALLATLAAAVLGCALLVLWQRTAKRKEADTKASAAAGTQLAKKARQDNDEQPGDDGRKRVAVFFGTQTGTAEGFAKVAHCPPPLPPPILCLSVCPFLGKKLLASKFVASGPHRGGGRWISFSCSCSWSKLQLARLTSMMGDDGDGRPSKSFRTSFSCRPWDPASWERQFQGAQFRENIDEINCRSRKHQLDYSGAV